MATRKMTTGRKYKADFIIIGGGLSGLVTAYELLDHGNNVIIFEKDIQENLGGLAKKSFGGVMMVDTPYQKKSGIKDSPELALKDWLSYAKFGKGDVLPRQWAERYVSRSIDMIYEWLTKVGVTFLPVVNWPERGMQHHGNSIPRWHIAWGTGYAIVAALLEKLESHKNRKNLEIYYEHGVDQLIKKAGKVSGCTGTYGANSESFSADANAIIIASGGICGGDLSMVKKNWYKKWGKPPQTLLNGSHRYADGTLHKVVSKIGGRLTHLDKQWHYAAGIHMPNAKMENEGLSLVPPRSALWFNAKGERIGPTPLVAYTDTRYLVEQICAQLGQYSWQIMNWKIAIKELAASGSEHMTAFRNKNKLQLVQHLLFGNKAFVNRMLGESIDFVAASSLDELIGKMNEMDNPIKVDAAKMKADIKSYDDMIDRGPAYFNDDQLRRIMNFRTYRGDKLRTCKFQKIDDPKARPLIAIREFILSRKSLGGMQTDLNSQVLDMKGKPIKGLFAVGETSGFGGGGIHGLGSLEGTFLGSCILTGRSAARFLSGKEV